MSIAALITAAALMLHAPVSEPSQLSLVSDASRACNYNCIFVCGSTYTDVRRCEVSRQLCRRQCTIKFPESFQGCNKGWRPTATGCKCIKPLVGHVCPR